MKKILLGLAALFFCVQATQAQLLPSFKLGIKGAVNKKMLVTKLKMEKMVKQLSKV